MITIMCYFGVLLNCIESELSEIIPCNNATFAYSIVDRSMVDYRTRTRLFDSQKSKPKIVNVVPHANP